MSHSNWLDPVTLVSISKVASESPTAWALRSWLGCVLRHCPSAEVTRVSKMNISENTFLSGNSTRKLRIRGVYFLWMIVTRWIDVDGSWSIENILFPCPKVLSVTRQIWLQRNAWVHVRRTAWISVWRFSKRVRRADLSMLDNGPCLFSSPLNIDSWRSAIIFRRTLIWNRSERDKLMEREGKIKIRDHKSNLFDVKCSWFVSSFVKRCIVEWNRFNDQKQRKRSDGSREFHNAITCSSMHLLCFVSNTIDRWYIIFRYNAYYRQKSCRSAHPVFL